MVCSLSRPLPHTLSCLVVIFGVCSQIQRAFCLSLYIFLMRAMGFLLTQLKTKCVAKSEIMTTADYGHFYHISVSVTTAAGWNEDEVFLTGSCWLILGLQRVGTWSPLVAQLVGY